MTGSLGTTLVVDASVVAKWYTPEHGSRQASLLLTAQFHLLAPEILIAELGNILWKKVRLGDMTFQGARSVVTRFASATPVSLQRLTPLLGSAFDIAHRYQRTVYDSLYLALAVAEGCQLITADERLVNSLQGTPLAGAVLGLSST